MTKQRYEGRTAAEAAIRACEELGLTRSELRHIVISDEGELLARRVVIEVQATTKAKPAAMDDAPGYGAEANGPATSSPAAHVPPRRSSSARTPQSREARPRAEEQGGRDDHGQQEPAPRRRASAPAQDAAPSSEDDGRSQGSGARGGRSRRGRGGERRPRSDEQAAAETPAGGMLTEPVAQEAAEIAPVVPTERAPRSRTSQERPARAPRERSRGRGRNQEQGEQQVGNDDEAPAAAEPRSAPRRNERGSQEDGGRGGERNGKRGRSGDGGRNQREGVDGLLAMQAETDFSQLQVPKLPAIPATSERSKRVQAVVADLVRLMGFDLETRLVLENEAEVHVHLYGSSEKQAIGDKGEVLLSLQFAVNRILSRQEDEGEQVLVLDAGGYRQRRQLAIEKLARNLAERALAHNKAVRLSPMSAHDRRIFHVALKDMEGIATQSEGDGVFRNLLILPAAFL